MKENPPITPLRNSKKEQDGNSTRFEQDAEQYWHANNANEPKTENKGLYRAKL